jgi:aspartate carbamoyltransferase catalytic subunit
MAGHFLSSLQLKRNWLENLFEEADKIRTVFSQSWIEQSRYFKGGLPEKNERERLSQCLKEKIIALLFFEPSTGTRIGFELAAKKLGAEAVLIENAEETSSAAKGETLPDLILRLAAYYSCGLSTVVVRHPDETAIRRAWRAIEKHKLSINLVNAGNGADEHPLQAIQDVYTIWRMRKEKLLQGKIVWGIFGDLGYARTAHSLALAASLFGGKYLLASFPNKEDRMPEWILSILQKRKCEIVTGPSIRGFAPLVDVGYFLRPQTNRERKNEPEKWLNPYFQNFGMTRGLALSFRNDALIMHPLPRTREMPVWFDKDPRAIYFREQNQNSLWTKMALFKMMLNPDFILSGQVGC